jgi:hypothetical protein
MMLVLHGNHQQWVHWLACSLRGVTDLAALSQAARVSDLEAQRSALLQQLTTEQQRHVLTRQKAAAQGQGEP